MRNYIWLVGAFALLLLSGIANASEQQPEKKQFGIEIAPEWWYAKWNPSFSDNCVSNDCGLFNSGYSIAPKVLSGLSVSGFYGKSSIFVNYLDSRLAPGSASSTSGDVRRWRELVGGILFWMGGSWYLESSVLSGNFSGTAWGDEWTRGVGTTRRNLSVDTSLTEGEVDALFKTSLNCGGGGFKCPDGFELGYRVDSYHLPALVEVYDDRGLMKIAFEDTRFLTNYLVLGAREFPDTKQDGWTWGISDLKGFFGVTAAKNADMNNKGGFSAGGEGECGVEYKKSWASAFVGFKGKVVYTTVGSKPEVGTDQGQHYYGTSHLEMTDTYYGPLARLTVRF